MHLGVQRTAVVILVTGHDDSAKIAKKPALGFDRAGFVFRIFGSKLLRRRSLGAISKRPATIREKMHFFPVDRHRLKWRAIQCPRHRIGECCGRRQKKQENEAMNQSLLSTQAVTEARAVARFSG